MLSPDELRKYSVFNTDQERDFYINASYGRNVKTVELVRGLQPRTVFEFGANPYFMTLMMWEDLGLDENYYRMANWFGDHYLKNHENCLEQIPLGFQEARDKTFSFMHFNVEDVESKGWQHIGGGYDVVLLCEILEHLLVDPVDIIARIKDMLRPGGSLVLTTPNVFSRHNQTLWHAGQNIYEWYSPNGHYGRHNRIWSIAEIRHFATAIWGFEVSRIFTHDAGLPAASIPADYTDQAGDTIFAVLRKPE